MYTIELESNEDLSENPVRVYSLEEYELDSLRIDIDDREKIKYHCRLSVWSRFWRMPFSPEM